MMPGDANASTLHFRMASNESDIHMPEIARSIIHAEGVELVREWTDAMEPVHCSAL